MAEFYYQNISLKIFITKDENSEKRIQLDVPIILNNCHEIFVKSVSIFLNYNNLDQNTYDNTKIGFRDGYYTCNILKTEFENNKVVVKCGGAIELEQVDFSGKCTIKSHKTLNLQTFGPIIGFSENKIISVNKLTESDNVVNINNLEHIKIYPPEETGGIKLSNGIYNELIFKVEGNNSSSIGNFLLEIIIK